MIIIFFFKIPKSIFQTRCIANSTGRVVQSWNAKFKNIYFSGRNLPQTLFLPVHLGLNLQFPVYTGKPPLIEPSKQCTTTNSGKNVSDRQCQVFRCFTVIMIYVMAKSLNYNEIIKIIKGKCNVFCLNIQFCRKLNFEYIY